MKRNATPWILGLLSAALLSGMGLYLRDLQPSLVEAQLTFSRAAFESVLSSWTPEQLQRFRQHFAADYAFLVVYGAFGWVLGRRITGPDRAPVNHPWSLPWLLPVAAAFDAVENALHLAFVSQSGAIPESLYLVAGLAASAKWTVSFAFAFLAIRAWRQNAK